ncbi:hypothetical protein N9W48_01780 [Candidatus Actinomarina sp.]|nr:hypothetical protein [Candidatus Actinomarina sp.]
MSTLIITLSELDSVDSVNQEKIDRFKQHYSQELQDGVITQEEFKENMIRHHKKGHHKLKGNR